MLQYKNINTEAIYHNGAPMFTVYHNGKIVWQGIKSSFGGGMWRNDMPWKNDDAWKN